MQNISQELWMLKLEELFCVHCCKKLRFAVIEFFWGIFFEFLIDLIVLYFGVYALVCVHVCVLFFSGAVTMPWFSDFRCWFTQRNRRPIPQIWILSSGLLCSHGGCKFKSPSQQKNVKFFFFSTRLHNSLKEHNHQVQINPKNLTVIPSFQKKQMRFFFWFYLFNSILAWSMISA